MKAETFSCSVQIFVDCCTAVSYVYTICINRLIFCQVLIYTEKSWIFFFSQFSVMDLHQFKMIEYPIQSRKDQVEKPFAWNSIILFLSTIKCKLMSNKYLFVIAQTTCTRRSRCCFGFNYIYEFYLEKDNRLDRYRMIPFWR